MKGGASSFKAAFVYTPDLLLVASVTWMQFNLVYFAAAVPKFIKLNLTHVSRKLKN